jgi:fatty-acyl-CoA synthase
MQDHPLTVSSLLRHGATVHGRSEVVTWTGGSARRAAFAEIAERAARLAGALRRLGIDGDQRVATLMWNNQEHMEAYLAVPSMGAVLHPLNLRLPHNQLVHIANHAEDHVVIVDADLVPLLGSLLPELKTIRHVIVSGELESLPEAPGVQFHDYEKLLRKESSTFDWPVLDENSAAAMCYTSGTTGDPRGVVYSHRSIYLHSLYVCLPEAFDFDDAARCLAVVPMFHVLAWGLPFAAFIAGASLLMPGRHLQAAPLADFIAAEHPTKAGAVPTIWAALLAHLDANGGDVSSLEEVIVGGAACPPALMNAFRERYGVRVLAAWGMTETSPLGSVARAPRYAEGPDDPRFRETAGRPPAPVAMRIVSEAGSVLPNDGESVGELEVSGPWITGSYHLSDAPDRFRDGWLRTGDVGSISPEGYLTISDRAKDVIKSGGEWISSVELENHLMAHPRVREAAVIGVPDERWDERPFAAVAWAEGEPDFHELHAFLAGRITRWQLPERWAAVPEVPKTGVGKFDKRALRRSYSAGEFAVTRIDR